MADYNIYIGEENVTLQVVSLTCFYGVNQIPELKIRMAAANGEEEDEDLAIYNLTKDKSLVEGEVIKINAELNTGEEPVKKEIFSGLITGQSIGYDGQSYTDILAQADVIKLTEGPITQLFPPKTSDKAIIDALFKDANAGTVVAEKGFEHQQYFIYQQTPWRAMMARVLANGFLYVPTPENHKVMAWKKPAKEHKVPLKGSGIEGFSLHQDLSSQINVVKTTALDIQKQVMSEPQTGKSDIGTHLKPIKGSLKAEWETSITAPLPTAELKAWANAQMIYRQLDCFQGEIAFNLADSAAPFDIKLMEGLDLSDFGDKFNGKYVVTGIEHKITPQGWWIYITLGLHLHHTLFSPWLTQPPVPHLMGKIGKMDGPPDELHQIPVWLPSISSNPEHVVLARLLSPFASKGEGFYFLPNKDDEVVVAFVGGDCRYPVIVGATHNPINKPAEDWKLNPGIYLKEFDGKNETTSASLSYDHNNKSFVLSAKEKDQPQSMIQVGGGKSRLKIEAQDKDGKSLMALELSGEKVALTKDDKNSITLAKNIDINTGGAVNITVGAKVEIKK